MPSGTPAPTQTVDSSGSPALALKFSATPEQAKAGDQVTFTLQILNKGKTSVTGLQFSDILPEGLSYIQSDSKSFALDEKTRQLTWTADKDTAILPGESFSLTYTVEIGTEIVDAQIVDAARLSVAHVPAEPPARTR